MVLGPIEVLVIEFPGNQFNGRIVPEIQSLVERGVIAVVDGLLIRKDGENQVTVLEFEETGLEEHLADFGTAMNAVMGDLISSDDIFELAESLDPDSSTAVLVVEHTWAKPFADAVVDSGGQLVHSIRVPKVVVDEVLAAAASLG